MHGKKWLYLFFTFIITALLALEINYRVNHYHRHVVDYLLNEFIPSMQDQEYQTIILGDSLAANTFNSLIMHMHILDLSSNQAISMAGNYFMLKRYLEKNRAPKEIFLFCIPMLLHNDLEQQWTYSYFETVFTRSDEIDEIKEIKPNLFIEHMSIDRYLESRKNALNFTTYYTPKHRVKHTLIDEKRLKKEANFMNEVISEQIQTAKENLSEVKTVPKIYLKKIADLCQKHSIQFTLVIEAMPMPLNTLFNQSQFRQYLQQENIRVKNINDTYTFNTSFFKNDGIHIGNDVNRYYQNLIDKYILDIY